MARTRFVVDLVTEDSLTNRQMQRLASEMNDWLQAVGSSEIEGRNPQEVFHHGHLHVSNDDRSCDTCAYLARDDKQ